MSDPKDENMIGGIPIRSEDPSFASDEMVECPKCSRRNPPTRPGCVYCGADLGIDPAGGTLRLTLRNLESWEKGFNLIIKPSADADPAAILRILKLDNDDAERLARVGRPVPAARVATLTECEALKASLSEIGVESLIVSDEELAPETLPRRLRAIEFDDSGAIFKLFNDESTVRIESSNVAAIVTGAVYQRAVEATEKRKKGETRILGATEIASDEALLDIYTADDPLGFRIMTAGFDFSCLGEGKGMLAAENIGRLAVRLREFAPEARFVDDYLQLREALGIVWEIDVRRDSQGMKRSSFGRFDLTSVSSSSNLRQYNMFSRLQRRLI